MGMKRINLIAVLIAALLIFISACSPTRISVEEYNRQHGITPEATVQKTQAPVVVPDAADEAESPEDSPQEVGVTGGVPDDIPIMEGAYELQSARSANNVTYQIDATVEEVVLFYQEELPQFGWELAGPPDNAIGTIGTMLRENAAGDQLAINMQFNQVGGFVRLNMRINRFE
jgi:hypothetical protein